MYLIRDFFLTETYEKGMGEAINDETKIYFEIYGDGEPLVLICGLTGSVDYYWHSLLTSLSSRFQVIIFDTRGMGKTRYNNQGFTLEQIADDAAHLLDHLGLEKASFFGHSMGAAVIQAFAKRYPTRIEKGILCNTFPKLNTKEEILLEGIRSIVKEEIPLKKVFWLLLPWIFSEAHLSSDAIKEKLRQFYETRTLSPLGLCHQIDALMAFDSTSWLSEIDTPMLVISSKEDIMFPSEIGRKMAEQLPNVSYVEIPGGHAAHVEQAPRLIELIRDYIE